MKTNGRNLDLFRCPQCNISKPLLTYKNSYLKHLIDRFKNNTFSYWLVYQCSYCKDPVSAEILISINDINIPIEKLLDINHFHVISIFPEPQNIPESLPESAAKYLVQALETKHSPDGCVMLAASSVDAMLKGKELKDGSLNQRINDALQKNIITKDMADWAHSIRLDANDVRHADDNKPHATEQDAEKCLAFAKTLGEILFTLPKRILDEIAKNVIPQEE